MNSIIACGKGWGIGINKHEDGNPSYGFPESENPNLFYPDPECCAPEEIKSWKDAIKNWKDNFQQL